MDGMHTVYCHTHGTITSSNARVGQAAQNPASKGLLSKGVRAGVAAENLEVGRTQQSRARVTVVQSLLRVLRRARHVICERNPFV